MKFPRDVSGNDVIKILSKFGYTITRQHGSHIRLTNKNEKGEHHVTIPNHRTISIGTLSGIVNDVSEFLNVEKEEIISLM
jgi:predicted RNA binding protein YcfA (HicA-like mRNA interferase family)